MTINELLKELNKLKDYGEEQAWTSIRHTDNGEYAWTEELIIDKVFVERLSHIDSIKSELRIARNNEKSWRDEKVKLELDLEKALFRQSVK